MKAYRQIAQMEDRPYKFRQGEGEVGYKDRKEGEKDRDTMAFSGSETLKMQFRTYTDWLQQPRLKDGTPVRTIANLAKYYAEKWEEDVKTKMVERRLYKIRDLFVYYISGSLSWDLLARGHAYHKFKQEGMLRPGEIGRILLVSPLRLAMYRQMWLDENR